MMAEWQDGNTAPRDNTSILAWVQKADTNETFYDVLRWYTPYDDSNDVPAWRRPDEEESQLNYNVLFWMPLPDPPAGQSSAF